MSLFSIDATKVRLTPFAPAARRVGSGADLSYANLEGVTGSITAEELVSQARSLEGATMPDDKPYQQASATDSAEEEREEASVSNASKEEATETSPTDSTEEELPTS